jgi:hypothetical protein
VLWKSCRWPFWKNRFPHRLTPLSVAGISVLLSIPTERYLAFGTNNGVYDHAIDFPIEVRIFGASGSAGTPRPSILHEQSVKD